MVTSTTAATALAVGPLAPRFEGVEQIAVLRGGGLGDLLFALPAAEALAAAYPAARITLLGTPLHADLLAGRPGPVAEVEVLPLARGVREAPGREEDPAGTDRFLERLAARRFDLGGAGARRGAVLQPVPAPAGGPAHGGHPHPRRRRPRADHPLPLLPARGAAGPGGGRAGRGAAGGARAARGRDGGGAGAAPGRCSDRPRRRCSSSIPAPPTPAGAGRPPASPRSPRRPAGPGRGWSWSGRARTCPRRRRSSTGPARRCRRPRRPRVTSCAGRLSLAGLTGLLAEADVLLGNDSGPRHLAQAVGTATVGLYWFGNVINAGPLGRARHRVHLGWMTACPVCGRDVTSETARALRARRLRRRRHRRRPGARGRPRPAGGARRSRPARGAAGGLDPRAAAGGAGPA